MSIVRRESATLGIHRLLCSGGLRPPSSALIERRYSKLSGLSRNLRTVVCSSRPRSVQRDTRRPIECLTALLVAVAALCFSTSRGPAQTQTAAPSAGRHVVVISVDGMGASFYAAPRPGLRIPNIRRLMEGGSYAEGVEGVYPTVTYPAHTTLVTGRPPAEHGVYSNLASREPGKNAGDWFWFASAIKVPTLWEEA
ncbi:MAG: hypothetical protein DMG26_10465, partial [Acidobacteria bacterium]